MPNRYIKETITTSETLAAITGDEERHFWRLVVQADDHGRFDARPHVIRAKAYAAMLTQVDEAEAERRTLALESAGLIVLYQREDRRYGYFVTWEKHQRVRSTISKFPPPTSADIARELPQPAADVSECPQMPANDRDPPQMSAVYGNGNGNDIGNENVNDIGDEDDKDGSKEPGASEESSGGGIGEMPPSEIPTDDIKPAYIAELEKLKKFRQLKPDQKRDLTWITMEVDEETGLLKLAQAGVDPLEEAKKFVLYYSEKKLENLLLRWRNWLYGENGSVARAMKQGGGRNGVTGVGPTTGGEPEDKWERERREIDERKARLGPGA